MSGITVEEKRDIIEKEIRRGRPYRYPYQTIEVGQTFFVAGEGRSFNHKVYLSVYRVNRKAGKKGPRFEMHLNSKMGEMTGIRVQRVR